MTTATNGINFDEWLTKAHALINNGPVLLWVSPKKWHANETVYFIKSKEELEKALSVRRPIDRRLEIIQLAEDAILATGFPRVSLMDLLWDNPYLNIVAGSYDESEGLIVVRHADPFWEFISDKDNKQKEFIFMRQPDWDNAIECSIER